MSQSNISLSRASRLVQLAQPADTDRQLLQKFVLEGSQDAFANLVRRHLSMVLGVCRRTVQNAQDAEDACQATFLILARKASGKWQESIANWLFSTARRVARDTVRANDRRQRRERQAAISEVVAAIEQLSARELLEAVDEELDQLPHLYREPMLLYYMQDLARDEIATRLGVPIGTVKIRLERGRKRLRAALTKRGFALGTGLLVLVTTSAAEASSPQLLESVLAATSGRPSAQVASLTKRISASGSVRKSIGLVSAISAAAALAITFGAMVFASQPRQSLPPQSPPARVAAPEVTREAVDLQGDPLPPGALLRIGTIRLRDGIGTNQGILSPDGKTIATASESGIMLFEITSGRRLRWLSDSWVQNGFDENSSRFAFSPDGKKLFVLSTHGDRGNSFLGSVIAYDLTSGKKLDFFAKRPPIPPGQPPSRGFTRLWFPAKSKHLVAVDEMMTVLIDPESGETTRTLPFVVRTVESTPDGIRFFSVEKGSSNVTVYDPEGKQIRTFEYTDPPKVLGLDPAGSTLTAAAGPDSKIRVWDLASGKTLVDLTLPDHGHSETGITTLAITPDRKTLVAGTQKGTIYRLDIATGKELNSHRVHFWYVTSLLFADGGKTLVSTGWDGHVVRWDLVADKPLSDPEGYTGHIHVDRSPDGMLIAAVDDSGLVELRDGITGKRLRVLQGVGKTAASKVAFAADGKSLATAHGDARLRIWESASGRLVREIEVVTPVKGKTLWLEGLGFSPDGRIIAASGEKIGTHAFEVETGKRLWSDEAKSGNLVFFPRGQSLAIGGWDEQIHFVDTLSGKTRRTESSVHDVVDGIAVSPDGKLLATSHHDGFVCLRDPVTGGIKKQWLAHTPDHVAWNVSFGPGGIWLASCGDNTVALWDVASGTLLHRFEGHTGRAYSVRFGGNGRTLLSSSSDQTGYVWDLQPKFGPGDSRKTAELWDDLGGDPKTSFRAVWQAAADPKAPAVFGEKLASPKKFESERFKNLVQQLDDPEFKVREAAEKELLSFGANALPHVRKAREGTDVAEIRDRLDRVIRRWSEEEFSPEGWRHKRAVVAMEMAGSAAARELLKRWASDAPGSALSDSAMAALGRLGQLSKDIGNQK